MCVDLTGNSEEINVNMMRVSLTCQAFDFIF